jgi:hypothetical protein
MHFRPFNRDCWLGIQYMLEKGNPDISFVPFAQRFLPKDSIRLLSYEFRLILQLKIPKFSYAFACKFDFQRRKKVAPSILLHLAKGNLFLGQSA